MNGNLPTCCYCCRYYTFIKHIIPETPIPASVIFREDEQFPEKVIIDLIMNYRAIQSQELFFVK